MLGAFNLKTLQTADVGVKGIYPIKYRVYHTIYSGNVVQIADPFIITIVDPCE